jgi:hypothetical protein
MVAKIDDFDSVPDEFEVDRVDRTIVPIANRNGGEDADRCWHEAQNLAAIACQAKRFKPNLAQCAPPPELLL